MEHFLYKLSCTSLSTSFPSIIPIHLTLFYLSLYFTDIYIYIFFYPNLPTNVKLVIVRINLLSLNGLISLFSMGGSRYPLS